MLDKVVEETDELREAARDGDLDHWAEEFGDLLFVLVNVARKRGIEAEAAVRAANAKFRRRFGSVERQAAARGVALRDLDFEALDALMGYRQGGGEDDDMTIGNRPPTVRADGRGPRDLRPISFTARCPEVGRGLMPRPLRRHARSCAPRRSPTACRRTCAARAPAG